MYNHNQSRSKPKVSINWGNNTNNKPKQQPQNKPPKNRTPGHDYRRRTRLQTGSNKLEKNLSVEIPISCMGLTKQGREYSGLSLINILDYLQMGKVFSLISIPVWIDFKYIETDDPKQKKKTFEDKRIIAGYMRYFKEDADAGITIYRNHIKLFESIKNPLIVPRVALDKENPTIVKCIIGFDIMERSKVAMFEKEE